MIYLSRKDLEAIANRVITAYMKLPELADDIQYRVQPELLLTKVLGLTVDYQTLSNDLSVLGLTSFCEMGIALHGNEGSFFYFLDGKTVLVEKALREDPKQSGRCNFTLLHEGGHQILKMLYPKAYGAAYRKVHMYKTTPMLRNGSVDWEEWQANTLAASILLPEMLIKRGMIALGLGEKIDMLNPVFAATDFERFSNLAELLGCSKRALSIRMKELGLLRRDYLDNPYDLVNIYVEDREYAS